MKNKFSLLSLIAITILTLFPNQIFANNEYQTHYVNSKTILIYYSLKNEIPEKESSFGLWMKENIKGDWTFINNALPKLDSHNRTYFEYSADHDGIYFFKTYTWLKDKPNVTSDVLPEVSVVIDTAVPIVEMALDPPPSDLQGGTEIKLMWTVKDKNLEKTPVTVYISNDNLKSWTVLKKMEIPNNSIIYKTPNEDIQALAFKVEVADLAGNLGTYVSPSYTIKMKTSQVSNPDSNNTNNTPPINNNNNNNTNTNNQPNTTPNAVKPHPINTNNEAYPTNNNPTPNYLSIQKNFNSDVVRIKYSIETESLYAVVLWYTNDNGENWYKYGNDPDLCSPFEFIAPNNGYYAFKIIAYSQALNPSSPEPVSGTKPDTPNVLIDTVPPVCAISSPCGGEYWISGKDYEISWIANDLNGLPERPISLYYSTDKLKWEKIVVGINNTVPYKWKIPHLNSNKLFIKISVRDIAGNSSEYILKYPINIEQNKPKVYIDSIQVADSNQENVSITNNENNSKLPVANIPTISEEAKVNARKHYEYARYFKVRGEYERAVDEFLTAITFDSINGTYFTELADTYSNLGEVKNAMNYFQKARELEPQNPYYAFNMANFAFNLDNYEMASDEIMHFLTLTTNDAQLKTSGLELAWLVSEKIRGINILRAKKIWQAIATYPLKNNKYKKNADIMLERYHSE